MMHYTRLQAWVILLALICSPASSQTTPPARNDAAEAAKNWSLFFEYHKNGDFQTAAPYGWKVIQLDPTKFKTVYRKLAECYYSFSQKEDSTKKQAHIDTMIAIYDLGIQKVPERSAELWLLRGYAIAAYTKGREAEAIASYEKGIELDPKADFAYRDQLGMLYINNLDKDPSYRNKGIALYRQAKEKDPNNPVPYDRLKRLVSDPHELIGIAEQDVKNDPENPEKIWAAAQAYIDAEEYAGAERHLQKLVKKSPGTSNYLNELAKVQQYQGKYRQAIEGYEHATKLNPALRENALNITVCYRMMKNYTAARNTALKATQKERGWGRPFMELAEVYKAAVENCVRDTKGGDWTKIDIDDKLMYRLAQEAFARAKSVDPAVASEATQRINELSTLVPTREDYFFNRARIVSRKIAVQGPCYGWVGEEVSVPEL